jgi:conjugative transfer signal peptidase TraF
MQWRIKSTRAPLIVALAMGLLLTARLAYSMMGPPLVINLTDSEPHGLYWLDVHKSGQYRRGQLVAFPVPDAFRSLVYGRRWLLPGTPLMKGIAALQGDSVCVDDAHILINGQVVGPVFSRDSTGRAMPKLRGCFTVNAGFFLPLSTLIANSFDGRYMGQQPLTTVRGEVHRIWTF